MTLPLIVGISGASGVIYGVELVRALHKIGHPVHLVISGGAETTLKLEMGLTLEEVTKLADVVHDTRNLAASISSGSFKTKGMVIAPCSIKTLSGIANSYNDNLLTRAADVCLKERRRLVLMVRETPLHKGHLDLMSRVADLGATLLPPTPSFYHQPKTILDIVHQSIGKALDQFDIEHTLFERWKGEDSFSI